MLRPMLPVLVGFVWENISFDGGRPDAPCMSIKKRATFFLCFDAAGIILYFYDDNDILTMMMMTTTDMWPSS